MKPTGCQACLVRGTMQHGVATSGMGLLVRVSGLAAIFFRNNNMG